MCERIPYRLGGGRGLLALAVAIAIWAPSAMGQVDAQGGSAASAEGATVKLPVYDVVSIKLNKSGSGSVNVHSDDNRYSASNVSLKDLLENAYGIKKDLISGVTGPVASARFDVEAKIVDRDPDALKELTNKQYGQMLLPFLVERFQLKAHTEIKILPVFELVVIKDGPKFKRSEDDTRGSGTSIRGEHNGAELIAHNLSMVGLASSLTTQVHRTVIDKTGLAGKYDLGMKWSADDGTAQADSFPRSLRRCPNSLG